MLLSIVLSTESEVQNRTVALSKEDSYVCLKHVTNSRKFDHVTPLLRELNWLPVKEQLFYRDSVLTFKCQNDLAPQYLTSKFTKRSNIHTRNTRTRNSLQIPLYRTAIGQHTFSYRGANIWNNLHNELRQSASLASFKRALKAHY